jgi:hypothetical protein
LNVFTTTASVSLQGGILSPNLAVKLTEISLRKGSYKPFDSFGCSSTTSGEAVEQFYAAYKLQIQNTGTADFIPPAGFVGEADCHKPTIYKFLQDGDESDGGVTFYLPCVVDDAAIATGSTACATAQSGGMKIRQGHSLGVSRVVEVKLAVPIEFLGIITPTEVLFTTLKVNPDISSGTEASVKYIFGNAASQIDWLQPGVFPPPFIIYYSPDGFDCEITM